MATGNITALRQAPASAIYEQAAAEQPIPVLKPLLPPIEQVIPYLRRIDAARYYSNGGPLWTEFRCRFADWLGARSGRIGLHVIPTSSGTTALELALRARALPGRCVCFVPSYTFIASVHAVTNVGLEPYLLDCSEKTLTLTPALVEAALNDTGERPAAVLVVSAFGAPPDIAGWDAFERKHGIPVIHDAAAATTSLKAIGAQPITVSLHATKVFGIGEGGAIITTDADLADRLVAMTNFGFHGSERLSTVNGGNYRISEYTAAMGLSVLDSIDEKIARMLDLGGAYTAALSTSCCSVQSGAGTKWATMTFNVVVPREMVATCIGRMDRDRIQWRRWWGLGTHHHPAFARLRRCSLEVTDAIAPRVLGIPFYDGMTTHDIQRVTAAFR